jgi:hypothetical protein
MRFNRTTISDIAVPSPSTDSIFCSCPTYLRDLFGTELCRILQDLYHFTRFINYYKSGSRSFGPRESTLFEVWNVSIEYRLLSYSNLNHGMSMCDYSLKEALRTAAILWISTGLWNFPFSASVVVPPAGHLVEILKQSDLNSWRERFPDILLWVLVVGACCNPAPGLHRTFLLCQLKFISLLRQFDSQEDIVNGLKRFIYMDGVYAEPLSHLWIDVVQACKA